jgi:hypothetical protein
VIRLYRSALNCHAVSCAVVFSWTPKDDDPMTIPTLVFDSFSEEFCAGPWLSGRSGIDEVRE